MIRTSPSRFAEKWIPLLALSGLLLVSWGLVMTPKTTHSRQEPDRGVAMARSTELSYSLMSSP